MVHLGAARAVAKLLDIDSTGQSFAFCNGGPGSSFFAWHAAGDTDLVIDLSDLEYREMIAHDYIAFSGAEYWVGGTSCVAFGISEVGRAAAAQLRKQAAL